MTRFSTDAIHAGRDRTAAQPQPHVPLIDLSSTYPIPDLEEAAESLGALAEGAVDAPNPVYARLSNPTVAGFERALADLEHAEEAVAFASGMGAVTACLLAARLRGAGHVVAIRPVYGGTDHLLCSGLTGLDVTWAQPTAASVADSIQPDTGLVILETPANPTLALVDIEAVLAGAGAVPVLVDSTFATPILQNPIDLGAQLVLHSATKFIGGHGDAVGGIVAGDAEWCGALRQVRIATGAILHPMAGYLFHRGLQTLPVRVARAQATARELASRLLDHPDVEAVDFPEFDPAWDRFGKYQMRGPGALLAFEPRGGYQAARDIMERVQLITPAVSLGSVDSLIQHPASLTHQVVSEEGKAAGGISDALLRVSIGLEHVEDLWADLRGALEHREIRAA